MFRFFAILFVIAVAAFGGYELLSHQGPIPYLQKFDGRWHFVIGPEPGESQGELTCLSQEGDISVFRGAFEGSLSVFGVPKFSLSINEAGELDGTFIYNSQHTGELSGKVTGSDASGVWHDNFECKGAFRLSKADPIIDPVAARVVSAHHVILLRGGMKTEVYPGEQLYKGDVLTADEDGQAYLAVGLLQTPLTVAASSSYTVAAPLQ